LDKPFGELEEILFGVKLLGNTIMGSKMYAMETLVGLNIVKLEM